MNQLKLLKMNLTVKYYMKKYVVVKINDHHVVVNFSLHVFG